VQQYGQRLRLEQRDPAEAQAFGARGQPEVLDGAGQGGQVHFRQGAATEDVFLPLIHQRHHQQLGALKDALDLEPHECVAALAQSLGGAHPLGLDLAVDGLAQLGTGDADKAPGLHQADAGSLVRRLEQAREQLRRHRAAGEVAHVAALGDGAVNRGTFLGTEGVVAHGSNSSAAARGLNGR